ncbi:hypothetical protein [Sphingopyxis sp.]|uniref:hypothetical protein n=1 Tax=Sphingopyxis sp. TaxID=1908224 RepID=UPI003BA85466
MNIIQALSAFFDRSPLKRIFQERRDDPSLGRPIRSRRAGMLRAGSQMGGYRYLDFVRVGLPLNLITMVAAIWAIQFFFPF